MRKLRAIWQLIKSDKWALFTYEEAPEDEVWATFPFFRWNISEKCDYFFRLIKERLYSIDNYNSALTNERKIYKEDADE